MSYKIENIVTKKGLIIKTLSFSSIDEITLSEEFLSLKEINIMGEFTSIKRKQEFYYVRVLWKSFVLNQEIFYNTLGRPYLENGYISISHSHNVIAIAFCPKYNVGIDVEYFSPKINRIKDKFISEKDRSLIDYNDEQHLTLAWSVKEAIYKMESIPGLSFKDNIHVAIEPSKSFVDVRKSNYIHRYNFEFLLFEKFVLTYCHEIDFLSKTEVL